MFQNGEDGFPENEDTTITMVTRILLMSTGDPKKTKIFGCHDDGDHKDNNQEEEHVELMIDKSPLTTPHVEENLEEVIESNQIGTLSGPSVKFRPPGCDKVLVKFVYTTAAWECSWSSSRREPISVEWETGSNKTKTESGMENGQCLMEILDT